MRTVCQLIAMAFLVSPFIAGWVTGVFLACIVGVVACAAFIVILELRAPRY